MVLTSNLPGTRIVVKDHSYVGAARRCVREFAESTGISGEPLNKLNVLASEMATNLAKHAENGGEIFVYDISNEKRKAIRLLCLDRGPGIANIEDALLDGVSSTSTLGGGLGALRRMSDSFEISSAPGKGTIISCTVFQIPERKPVHSNENISVGLILAPHPNEKRCGDIISLSLSDQISSLLVVDALGHGDAAADVSELAASVFQQSPFEDAQTIVTRIHRELAGSRGAALALAQIFHYRDKLVFVGVGNISARVFMKYQNRGCASIQGIVGGQISSLKEYEYDWGPNASLLMYSDGIKSAAMLSDVPVHSAQILAAEIYRDFSRMNDDTSVLVARDNRS